MDPPPDYGFDKYQGTGKLKGKVRPRTKDNACIPHRHACICDRDNGVGTP